ncbi:MAG: GNAT family N-acetyltransferase [Solirubrobacteraceae bacterium]
MLELWSVARSRHAVTPDHPATLEALLRTAADALLVAEPESPPGGLTIVGTVIAAWDGWRGHLYRLAVDPAHRRAGLGLRLVRAAEDLLYSKGARRINAIVGHDDAPAVALWVRAGYEHDPAIGRYVRDL